MRANRAGDSRTLGTARILMPLLILGLGGCADGELVEPTSEFEAVTAMDRRGEAAAHLTGSVDLVWPGGKGANAPDDDRIAQAEVTAFEAARPGKKGHGSFVYRVVAQDGRVHREIGVRLVWAGLDHETEGVVGMRFMGVVVSDTKPCGGSGHGGPGGGEHDDGGCSGEDGGCSHDDGSTHDDGGCSGEDGETHDDGGCSHDDGSTHDEGGCSGSDDHGGAGGPGGPGGPGGKVSGQDCRLGQYVIGWVYDGGSPARKYDRISWKWMAPDAPKVLEIQAAISAGTEIQWPCKLCEKDILGGNLKLHRPKN